MKQVVIKRLLQDSNLIKFEDFVLCLNPYYVDLIVDRPKEKVERTVRYVREKLHGRYTV